MKNLILYTIEGSVATITLNRPERVNAMDQEMLKQLIAAADRAEKDDQVRAVEYGKKTKDMIESRVIHVLSPTADTED